MNTCVVYYSTHTSALASYTTVHTHQPWLRILQYTSALASYTTVHTHQPWLRILQYTHSSPGFVYYSTHQPWLHILQYTHISPGFSLSHTILGLPIMGKCHNETQTVPTFDQRPNSFNSFNNNSHKVATSKCSSNAFVKKLVFNRK